MNKKVCMRLIILSLLVRVLCAQELSVSIGYTHDAAHKPALTKIACVATENDAGLIQVLDFLQQDIERSGQCSMAREMAPYPKNKKEVLHYYEKGYAYVFFAHLDAAHNCITGRLYDAVDGTMLFGKKWPQRAHQKWARKIAQDMWQALMGNAGSFASHIVYTKKISTKFGKSATQLCLVDYDGGNEKIVTTKNGVLAAPSWHHSGEYIFCSQFASSNVRIIATDLTGFSWVVCDRDGTNMGVSSCAGCADTIYCHSGTLWKYSYNGAQKKSCHALVVRDADVCACPTMLPNGNIIYCSQGRIKEWQADAGQTRALTHEGFCAGPAYHPATKRVAYSQKVGKTMQLFVLDLGTLTARQMTKSAGDKIDPSWSPCGIYIAYCVRNGKKSEIALFNSLTREEKIISPAGTACSCPAWSPLLPLS